MNLRGFNLEIKYFLVNDYFDDFVKQDKLLSKMYNDKEINALDFLCEFRKKIQNHIDDKVLILSSAKKLMKKTYKKTYIRDIK